MITHAKDVTPVIHFESGVEIELLTNQGCLLGIGSVHVGETSLRDGVRPLFVDITDPSGKQLVDFRIIEIKRSAEEVVVVLSPKIHQLRLMEWMLHTVRNRQAVTDWTDSDKEAEGTKLELILKPVSRKFGNHDFKGFSYQYRYSSPEVPIYKILDRGTWEPGGSVIGSEFWMRNGTVPSIIRFTDPAQRYSTEWYLPEIQQPNIFQFFPFQAALQGFTYTASEHGALVTWATEVAHIRSLFEKHAGKGALFHWHEHCGDLSHEFATSPVEVLWSPEKGASHVDRLNQYDQVRDFVWHSLHDRLGLRYEHIEPYGVIEEWELPDMDDYREAALPAFLHAGIKTIFVPNQFENNMNVWGLSNMCCNVDYKVAESVNPSKFAALCAAARAGGARVEMWGNTALSTLSYIFDMKNGASDRIKFLPNEDSIHEVIRGLPNAYVRNHAGAVEADHYTPVFCQLNLREPKVLAYWHKRWRELHEEIGVDQVFIDSSFNMSADKFTHRQNDESGRSGGATIDQTDLLGFTRPAKEPRQAIESQYLVYHELLVEMQKYGYIICGEDVGIFGLSRSGPDIEQRLPALPLWVESYSTFSAEGARKAGYDPDDAFFRGLAYRVMWQIFFNFHTRQLSFSLHRQPSDYEPREWHFDLLRAFTKADTGPKKRTILPGEVAVRFDGPRDSILWVLADDGVSVGNTYHWENLVTGAVFSGSEVKGAKNNVFRLTLPNIGGQ